MTLYTAKITENISVTVLSFGANIKPAAHLCFGNNVTCYMSVITQMAIISGKCRTDGMQFLKGQL